jgi:hypothetical protein
LVMSDSTIVERFTPPVNPYFICPDAEIAKKLKNIYVISLRDMYHRLALVSV